MSKKLRQLVITLVVMCMTMGLVSCGAAQNNQGNPQSSATPAVESANPTASPEQATQEPKEVTYPITIKGTDGEEVVLEKEPQKIVSLGPNITEIIYQLEASDKLVGRTEYCDYPAEVSKVQSVGTLSKPNIETIISLQPDLVIASTHVKEEDANKLKEVGIPVVVLYEKHDVEGVYTMINTLGIAFNREAQAKETIEAMKEKIADVEKAVKDLEPKSVYYVVGYGEGGDYTAGGDTFVAGMLKLAGGDNIASDVEGWSYSLETLLEKDPEYIIVRKGEKEAFKSSPNYKTLTAVKEDKVVEIDNNLLDRQSYRNADGVLELAKILHPEAFNK